MDQNRRNPWTSLGRLTLGALVACVFPAFGVAQEAPAMNHTEAKPVLTNPEAFDASDRDADGVVSWEEYRNAITKIFFEGDSDGDGNLAGDELKIIRPNRMAFVDTSKDGKVQLGEFTSAAILVFATADANGDGTLTRDELAAYVKNTGGDK